MLMSQNDLMPLCISAELGQVVKKELNLVLIWPAVMLSSVEPAEVMGMSSLCLQVQCLCLAGIQHWHHSSDIRNT